MMENIHVLTFRLGDSGQVVGGIKRFTMVDIPKVEKKIEILSEKVGASEEGTLWIKESLDPFSDEPRRFVGFPDLITGNSVVQVVKQAIQYTVGATPEDVHIFLDTVDTTTTLMPNTYLVDGTTRLGALKVDAIGGTTPAHVRGGLVLRSGPVGSALTAASTKTAAQLHLASGFVTGGATRVLSKAFEVHNTTNKLNVGGAVTVYRQTDAVPHNDHGVMNLCNNTTPTSNLAYSQRRLTKVPETLSDCTLIPGSQQWEAKDGCYNVAIMASQTNDPSEERIDVLTCRDSALAGTQLYANTFIEGVLPRPQGTSPYAVLASPFFLSGAFFSGLPAASSLTINLIYVIERFVDSTNLDLVTLSTPSPFYDPIALELYSKSAAKLPHGVKASSNADGDWIKNVADVLSTFGVPGMPLVKGAVDLWNGFNRKDDPAAKVGRMQGSTWSKSQPMNPRPQRGPRQRRVLMPPLPQVPNGGRQQPKRKPKKNKKVQKAVWVKKRG